MILGGRAGGGGVEGFGSRSRNRDQIEAFCVTVFWRFAYGTLEMLHRILAESKVLSDSFIADMIPFSTVRTLFHRCHERH